MIELLWSALTAAACLLVLMSLGVGLGIAAAIAYAALFRVEDPTVVAQRHNLERVVAQAQAEDAGQ